MELVSSLGTFVYSCFIATITLGGVILVFNKNARLKNRYSPFTESSLRLPGDTLSRDLNEIISSIGETMFFYVAAGVGAVLLFLVLDHPIRNILLLSLLLLMAYQLFRLWQLFERSSRVRLGLEGEEYIGQELNLLMCKGAHVFHDIPFKYGNIDHIVIGNDCVFVVETKAVSKPVKKNNKDDKKVVDAKVQFDGKQLIFPHFTTCKPIEQAVLGADHVRKILSEKCNSSIEVIPVIALPGWYINNTSETNELYVINGKRGKALYKRLGRSEDRTERNKVTAYIESVARSTPQRSKMNDPNGNEYYDFWFNPKYQKPSLT